jgi:DNA-binding MarR family transcriptional regulator
MTGKTTATPQSPIKARISDEALETGKLLVEFLHATYATRRQRMEAGVGEPAHLDAAGNFVEGSVTARDPLSAHAVRAAIHIYQHGERTVGQLASGLGISYGWASRVVEELEAAHYVVRGKDVADRRIVRVRLNEDALEEVERAYAWRGEAVARALEPLTPGERTAVRLFLRRVIDLLREEDPDSP